MKEQEKAHMKLLLQKQDYVKPMKTVGYEPQSYTKFGVK